MPSVIVLNIIVLSSAMMNVIVPNAVMLSVVLQSVIMLSVTVLKVMAPNNAVAALNGNGKADFKN